MFFSLIFRPFELWRLVLKPSDTSREFEPQLLLQQPVNRRRISASISFMMKTHSTTLKNSICDNYCLFALFNNKPRFLNLKRAKFSFLGGIKVCNALKMTIIRHNLKCKAGLG